MAQPPPRKPGAPRIGGPPGNAPPELETGKERLANEQLADLVTSLEEELEEIKVKYEMYFIGAERMEPARRRDDLKRNVARLMGAFTRNAGIRFRIQALHARFLSYERLWLRSTREKEAGTYRRDLLKARRKAVEGKLQPRSRGAAEGADGAPVAGPPTPEQVDAAVAEAAAAPSTPPVPAPAVAARPAAPAPPRPPPLPGRPTPTPVTAPAMSEPELRALYDNFVAAKRSCNEDTSRFTFEALARTVNKQAPEIAAKFKAKRVEFKVAVRGGKAVLTAVPRT